MSINNNGVWIRVLLPEDLHSGLKSTAVQEKLPDGSRKTLQDKIIECLNIGYKQSEIAKKREKKNLIS